MTNISLENAQAASKSSHDTSAFTKMRQRLRHPIRGQEAYKQKVAASEPTLMKRNAFIVESGSGAEQSRYGRRGEGTDSEYAEIGGEVMKQHAIFIDRLLTNLTKMNRNHLNGDEHAHERRLIEILDVPTTPGNATEAAEEKKQNIKRFLQSEEGMHITTQLMDRHTALNLFGLALDASARYGRDRQGNVRPQRVPVAVLVGHGRSGVMRTRFGRQAHVVGVDTLGAGKGAGGAIVGAPVGAGIGALIDATSLADLQNFALSIGGALANPVAVGALAGVGIVGAIGNRLFSPEGDVDLTPCADALQVVRGNPARAAYLKAMTGIDANDFLVNNGRVEFARPVDQRGTSNINGAIRGITENMRTRRAFYESLGYPHMRRGEMMDQLFTRANTGGIQQLTTRHLERIDEILDKGNPASAYNTMPLPGMGTMAEHRRNLYMDAQQQVVSRYIEDYFTTVKGGRSQEVGISALEAKVNAAKTPESVSALTKKRDERLKLLVEDKKFLTTHKKALFGDDASTTANSAETTTTRADQEEKEKERRRVEAEFALDFKDDVDANRTLEQAIQYRRELLLKTGTIGAVGGVGGRDTIAKLKVDARAILTGIENANPVAIRTVHSIDAHGTTTNVTEETVHPLVVAARERYASDIHDIEQLALDIKTEITTLKELNARDKTASEALTMLQAESSGYGGFVEASQRAFRDLYSAGLSQDELANSSFDQLLVRINALKVANPGLDSVWLTENDNNLINREKLLAAMFEAKVAERSSLEHVGNEADFNALFIVENIGERQLAAANSDAEIMRLSNNKYARDPLTGWPPNMNRHMKRTVESAMRAAKARGGFRKEIFDIMETELDAFKRNEEIEIERLRKGSDVKQAEVAVDLGRRQSTLIRNSQDIVIGNLNEMFDPSSASTADNLTDEEKKLLPAAGAALPIPGAQIPRGYFNTLNFLFDYQNRGIDRADYFGKMQKAVSPQQFVDLVVNSPLNAFLAPAAGPATVHSIFQAFHTAVQNGTFTDFQLREFSLSAIEQLLHRGNSLNI